MLPFPIPPPRLALANQNHFSFSKALRLTGPEMFLDVEWFDLNGGCYLQFNMQNGDLWPTEASKFASLELDFGEELYKSVFPFMVRTAFQSKMCTTAQYQVALYLIEKAKKRRPNIHGHSRRQNTNKREQRPRLDKGWKSLKEKMMRKLKRKSET